MFSHDILVKEGEADGFPSPVPELEGFCRNKRNKRGKGQMKRR
jgi:hypothetical protein